jgi:beta-N-acetylhexosaminidase
MRRIAIVIAVLALCELSGEPASPQRVDVTPREGGPASPQQVDRTFRGGEALDRDAQRWVEATMKKLTSDQMVGQLLMPRFAGVYTSSDSDIYDRLSTLIRDAHVGGVIGFGGEEAAPSVLLNPTYGPIILGQPLALASMLNRLQALATVPLLTAADFEWGVGMRISGATTFPRAMAFGAAGDDELAFEAGRITATEGRALGVHVNFAPVADVSNNPRNPVINIRSFGEDVRSVAALASAWARGLQQGGMLATLKHFPGHGDTAVDSHLGLPVIPHPRDRLEQIELVPFRSGIRTSNCPRSTPPRARRPSVSRS